MGQEATGATVPAAAVELEGVGREIQEHLASPEDRVDLRTAQQHLHFWKQWQTKFGASQATQTPRHQIHSSLVSLTMRKRKLSSAAEASLTLNTTLAFESGRFLKSMEIDLNCSLN